MSNALRASVADFGDDADLLAKVLCHVSVQMRADKTLQREKAI